MSDAVKGGFVGKGSFATGSTKGCLGGGGKGSYGQNTYGGSTTCGCKGDYGKGTFGKADHGKGDWGKGAPSSGYSAAGYSRACGSGASSAPQGQSDSTPTTDGGAYAKERRSYGSDRYSDRTGGTRDSTAASTDNGSSGSRGHRSYEERGGDRSGSAYSSKADDTKITRTDRNIEAYRRERGERLEEARDSERDRGSRHDRISDRRGSMRGREGSSCHYREHRDTSGSERRGSRERRSRSYVDAGGDGADQQENTVYVGGLAYQATADDVKAKFSEAGDVSQVNLITDRDTGRSKGFAFVTFSSSAGVDSAYEWLDGCEICGRAVRLGPPNGGRGAARSRSSSLWRSSHR